MNIINITTYLLALLFWPISHKFFVYLLNGRTEIGKNINHFLHALIYVFLYKIIPYHVKYLILVSIAFYTFDTGYIMNELYREIYSYKRQLPYLIHHGIAIYGLYLAYTDYYTEIVMYFYYLLEYSNFMLYISYHIQKSYPNNRSLQLVSQSLQLVWYSYFRIIRFLVYLYKIWPIFLETTATVKTMFVSLFIMGFYWSFNLFKKCKKEIKLD